MVESAQRIAQLKRSISDQERLGRDTAMVRDLLRVAKSTHTEEVARRDRVSALLHQMSSNSRSRRR